jgi:hypothetical protein
MAMSEHMFGTFGPLERKWADYSNDIGVLEKFSTRLVALCEAGMVYSY